MTKPVFISYARDDRDFVVTLAKRLQERGIESWYDESLRGGQAWPRRLEKAIRESRALLVVVSRASVKSDWVLREILFAQERQIAIIPYQIEEVAGWLTLQDLQRVASLSELLAALGEPPMEQIPPNPFVPLSGRIDDARLFFDREREIERIFEYFNAGSSVALIGEREVGKSSLAHAAARAAPKRLSPGLEPILIDLQQVRDEDDFYDAFCHQAGVALSRGYSLKRALEGKRFLLVLDEVEKMSWEGFSRDLRSQLRGLAEGQSAPLRLLIAARTPLDRLFPDSEKGRDTSPLAGICVQVGLDNWDEPAVRKLIESRLGKSPIRFSDSEIGSMLNETGGHPRRFMGSCHRLYSEKAAGFR